MIKKNTINKTTVLRISIAIVYLWFGVLKLFPNVSPAEDLAQNTITSLTLEILSPNFSIYALAVIEVFIGLTLLFNVFTKTAVIVALSHLVFTFTPLLFFPDVSFAKAPFIPSLTGQYILKNIIIISALIMIYPCQTSTNQKLNSKLEP